jgi:hypothetical protein
MLRVIAIKVDCDLLELVEVQIGAAADELLQLLAAEQLIMAHRRVSGQRSIMTQRGRERERVCVREGT